MTCITILFFTFVPSTHAVGMAVLRPYGSKIDFETNPFSGSAAWFFVIILNFILTPIFEIKIPEK